MKNTLLILLLPVLMALFIWGLLELFPEAQQAIQSEEHYSELFTPNS